MALTLTDVDTALALLILQHDVIKGGTNSN